MKLLAKTVLALFVLVAIVAGNGCKKETIVIDPRDTVWATPEREFFCDSAVELIDHQTIQIQANSLLEVGFSPVFGGADSIARFELTIAGGRVLQYEFTPIQANLYIRLPAGLLKAYFTPANAYRTRAKIYKCESIF